MRKISSILLTVCIAALVSSGSAAAPRFEKVSDHCYYIEPSPGGAIVGAVVTAGGVLLINPPAQPVLDTVLEAMKRLTAKPPTWIVNTDYQVESAGGSEHLAAQDATVIASREQRQLPATPAQGDGNNTVSQRKDERAPGQKGETSPRFYFTKQMRLFPDGLEIKVVAVGAKARTAGDLVVFVPAEKVLYTGNLFQPGSYPEIDATEGDGSALGWIDGMRRVVEMVPLLKSAMPPPKPDPSKPQPEEKTLEEQVVVVPGSGAQSNLQDVKDLLEAAHKLRSEISKLLSSGRTTRESFLSSPSLGPFRSYTNFEAFANRLYDELAAQKPK